jgi:hypothetical protein
MLCLHLLQYLRGAKVGVTFSGSSLDLHIYTDADWAGDVMTTWLDHDLCGIRGWWPYFTAMQAADHCGMQAEYQAMYAGMQEIV